MEVRCNSSFSQTEPSQLNLLLNKAVVHPSKFHLATEEELHCFILSNAKLSAVPHQVIELTKKLRKKERNKKKPNTQ